MCSNEKIHKEDVSGQFNKIWTRIKKETGIKNLTELAHIVESTQQYVSRKKKLDDFPIKWAYFIGKKHNLLTEWVFTGQGPKRLTAETIGTKSENEFLQLLIEWVKEIADRDPKRKEWFKCQIEDKFPTFKE